MGKKTPVQIGLLVLLFAMKIVNSKTFTAPSCHQRASSTTADKIKPSWQMSQLFTVQHLGSSRPRPHCRLSLQGAAVAKPFTWKKLSQMVRLLDVFYRLARHVLKVALVNISNGHGSASRHSPQLFWHSLAFNHHLKHHHLKHHQDQLWEW